jgi:hypothetical protein
MALAISTIPNSGTKQPFSDMTGNDSQFLNAGNPGHSQGSHHGYLEGKKSDLYAVNRNIH